MLPNDYPDQFAENFLPAIFILACQDYWNPKYHDEAEAFLESEAAELISGGRSKVILKRLRDGWKPGNKSTWGGCI